MSFASHLDGALVVAAGRVSAEIANLLNASGIASPLGQPGREAVIFGPTTCAESRLPAGYDAANGVPAAAPFEPGSPGPAGSRPAKPCRQRMIGAQPMPSCSLL